MSKKNFACILLMVMASFLLVQGCTRKTAVVPSSEKEHFSKAINKRRQLLLAHYREWKGVGYRFGGMDKSGVDCSGFVYLTYRRFGKVVPRTVEEMAYSGREVDEARLVPGDLVLFKTGWFEHHAGIYMGKRTFLHVSSSRGVIISSMDDYYWKDRLWRSRRILE